MKLRNAYLLFLMVATVPHGRANDNSTQPKKNASRVAREFVNAISTGKTKDAAELCWPERYDEKRLRKLVEMIGNNKWTIESLDANEDVALVITSEIEVNVPGARGKKTGFSIEVRKREGTWLVRDIDFEPPGRAKEKRKKFLRHFPDAKPLVLTKKEVKVGSSAVEEGEEEEGDGNPREVVTFFKGTWEDVLKEASRTKRAVMVDFSTEWCVWCKVLSRETFSDKEVAQVVAREFISVKIDAEKGEGPELTQIYGVAGFPTVVFTTHTGEEIDRIRGFLPPEKFLAEITRFQNGESFKTLKEQAAKKPSDVELQIELGKKYEARQKYEKSDEIYRRIITDKSRSDSIRNRAQGRLALIAFLNKPHDVSKLKSFFEKHSTSKDVPVADHARALFGYYRASKNHREALNAGDYLLKYSDEKDNADFLSQFALYLATEDLGLEKALDLANQAVRLRPKNPRIVDVLADVYFHNGMFKEAVETEDRAGRLEKDLQRKKYYEKRLKKFKKSLSEKNSQKDGE